jgi:hypothetical protein
VSARDLEEMLARPAVITDELAAARTRVDGVIVGELVGFMDNGATPLVIYPGQSGTAATAARTVPDLRGSHIGRQVLLMFEDADPQLPIVIGCLQTRSAWPLEEKPAQVDVDADGERLVVSAKNEIVLRCGQASITLTRAGKVLIRGTYLLSRSSGVNRIKGGSVQIN